MEGAPRSLVSVRVSVKPRDELPIYHHSPRASPDSTHDKVHERHAQSKGISAVHLAIISIEKREEREKDRWLDGAGPLGKSSFASTPRFVLGVRKRSHYSRNKGMLLTLCR